MGDKKRKFDVFISYGGSDEKEAKHIAVEFKKHGLVPWLEQDEVRQGEEWARQLRDALDATSICVVLVSSSTDPHSAWVSREWSEIQRRVWQDPDFTVVPVLLGEGAELPSFLREWKSISVPDSTQPPFTGSYVVGEVTQGSTGPTGSFDQPATSERFRWLTEHIADLASTEEG